MKHHWLGIDSDASVLIAAEMKRAIDDFESLDPASVQRACDGLPGPG